METPKRIAQNHTPKLSERKKNLFRCTTRTQARPDTNTSDDDNLGLTPLLDNNGEDQPDELETSSWGMVLRKSTRHLLNSTTNIKNSSQIEDTPPAEEQLQHLFSRKMSLHSEKPHVAMDSTSLLTKRRNDDHNIPSGNSPQRKTVRCEGIGCEPSLISTRRFYSINSNETRKTPQEVQRQRVSLPAKLTQKIMSQRRKFPKVEPKISNERTVIHKVRKITATSPPNHHCTSFGNGALDMKTLLGRLRNEKLRNIVERHQQVNTVHQFLRQGANSVDIAKPLKAISANFKIDDANNNNNNNNVNNLDYNEKRTKQQEPQTNLFQLADFSDIESESVDSTTDIEEEEIIPFITHSTHETLPDLVPISPRGKDSPVKRKFFKTRNTNTPKQVNITDHIKATLLNGKISLVQEKKKPRRFRLIERNNCAQESEQHATVNRILQCLDNELVESKVDSNLSHTSTCTSELAIVQQVFTEDVDHHHPASVEDPYATFRNRLPYNTTDPNITDQQRLLLEFLICNQICTEENFNIFIVDPDGNKAKAASIVDQVIEVVGISTEEVENTENRNKINTNQISKILVNRMDPVNNTTCSPSSTKSIEENSRPNLYPIFERNKCQVLKPHPALRRLHQQKPSPQVHSIGMGADQYQIDAGQSLFGASQCKQCGLVYSIHEPEEEKIHQEYHSSQHLLRLKQWIDEDVVATHSDWGPDGRILRITESSTLKRRERLRDIISIVDKELGFTGYQLPSVFAAFIAVRRAHVIGVCLIHPLQKAYKYICIDGVDCCCNEEFPAKCGISRIWTSPLHRRLRIANRLVEAMRMNTLLGEEIPMESVAFSVPTEAGRKFAQHMAKTENFLVYQ